MSASRVAFLAAFLTRFALQDFVTYSPNGVFGSAGSAATFQGFSSPLQGYIINSGFTATQALAVYAGSVFNLGLSWVVTFGRQGNDPAKTLGFSLASSAGDLGTFQLTLGSNGVTVVPQTGCSTVSSNNGQTTTATCTTNSGQRYTLTTTVPSVATSGISVVQGGSTTTGYSFYNVQVTYSLTPTAGANGNSMSSVEQIQMALLYSAGGSLPITLQNLQMTLTQCPVSCLACSSATVCTTCLAGFYIVGGNCTCAGSLVNYFARDSNPLNTPLGQAFYYGTTSCITVNQFNTQISTAQTCQALLSSMLLSNQISLQASQSLANSGVNVVFTANSTAVATLTGSACFNQTMFVNAIGVGAKTVAWPLEVAVGSESALVLNQQFPIVFPSTSYCSSQSYTSFGIQATVCPIDTIFFMRSIGFNSTLAIFHSRLITITGASASGRSQLFVPIFATNPNVTMEVTGNFSAVLCLDVQCSNIIAGQSIMATQALWVRVIFYDPIINYYTPQVFATLSVNGADANGLLQATTVDEEFSYTAVLYQINLQTVTTAVTMTFQLTMNVGISTPATYTSQSVLKFSLNVIPKQVIIVPFQNSLRFFVLVFTVALTIFLMLVGSGFYLIDRARTPAGEYWTAPSDQGIPTAFSTRQATPGNQPPSAGQGDVRPLSAYNNVDSIPQ